MSSEAPASYSVSLDKNRLQVDVVHDFLSRSYWSPGIPRATVERAIANSLCAGAYAHGDGRQVGFARLVTDHATFGYLADVFVLPEHRGHGLGAAVVHVLLDLPEVRAMRRLLLATRDAHALYARLGFTQVEDPRPFMQILRKDVYAAGPTPG
jgi:GNAT superfamily N-acetyltransferase